MPALPEMAAMRPSLTMVSSVATGAKPQVNRPPTSTPMNSALYASLVMSASMIAMMGGSSDQAVFASDAPFAHLTAATTSSARMTTATSLVRIVLDLDALGFMDLTPK